MDDTQSTCWTMIAAAAAGDRTQRNAFVERYDPIIRDAIAGRWARSAHRNNVNDAAQEVFVRCFTDEGVLERATRGSIRCFRAFLLGIARNVCRQFEDTAERRREQRITQGEGTSDHEAADTRLSEAFDRAWIRTILREARLLQESRANETGPAAKRRVDLLRLRFNDGLKTREIAARWGVPAREVQLEYGKARADFEHALHEVVTTYFPQARPDRQIEELLGILFT